MKIKGLLIAVVLLAAVTGTLYWSNLHPPAADSNAAKPPGAPDLGPAMFTFNQDDIVKFDLKKAGVEQAVLAKDAAGNWHTTSPSVVPVAPDAISGLMTALAKLTSDRVVEEKPADLGKYGLTNPKFETGVTTKDGKTRTLLIGEDAPVGQVTYAMLQGDPRVFTIPGYVKDIVDRKPRDLRDRRLITMPADKINRVDVTGKQGMAFVHDNGEWRMDQPKLIRADASAIDAYVDNLTMAEMDNTAINQTTEQADDGFADGAPLATVKVTGDSGSETLEIRKNKDVYYAKATVGGVYKISATTSEGIVKPPDDFRDKKLFDFGVDDPDKIELHDGPKTYLLSKFGDDWHLGGDQGPKVDPTAAQELAGKLRSLVAIKFPDSGFAAPSITVTVTSGSGKHVEKVAISKNGSRALGKREGEPLLYELDPTLVGEMEASAAAIKPVGTK